MDESLVNSPWDLRCAPFPALGTHSCHYCANAVRHRFESHSFVAPSEARTPMQQWQASTCLARRVEEVQAVVDHASDRTLAQAEERALPPKRKQTQRPNVLPARLRDDADRTDEATADGAGTSEKAIGAYVPRSIDRRQQDRKDILRVDDAVHIYVVEMEDHPAVTRRCRRLRP